MKAWTAAARQAKFNGNAEAAKLSKDSGSSALDEWLAMKARWYADQKTNKCFFCGESSKLTVGILPIAGTIYKCSDCKPEYDRLKADEGKK